MTTFQNLAERMRPSSLSDFLGQNHLVGPAKLIRRMIEEGQLSSLIFWGPPGTGKTTLARIIAKQTKADFYQLSAVVSGKADLNLIIEKAKENLAKDIRTILFIDEIHRWNKAQQAFLLPHIENGTLILIGATTENPSFEVIGPLLSRCRVYVLNGLDKDDLEKIVRLALSDNEKGLGKYNKKIKDDALKKLLLFSGGDARILLNGLEIAVLNFKEKEIDEKIIEEIFQRKNFIYDKNQEEHYNTISAFIKSLRASETDAALYYMLRMLSAGEDPKFIARRMIIFAAEDIGLADRGALIIANSTFEAVEKIGLPEANLILSSAAIYLAKAKKSRMVANAMNRALEVVKEYPNEQIPLFLRNAPTKLMKDLGYANGYVWSDSGVGPAEKRNFLPEKITQKKFVIDTEK